MPRRVPGRRGDADGPDPADLRGARGGRRGLWAGPRARTDHYAVHRRRLRRQRAQAEHALRTVAVSAPQPAGEDGAARGGELQERRPARGALHRQDRREARRHDHRRGRQDPGGRGRLRQGRHGRGPDGGPLVLGAVPRAQSARALGLRLYQPRARGLHARRRQGAGRLGLRVEHGRGSPEHRHVAARLSAQERAAPGRRVREGGDTPRLGLSGHAAPHARRHGVGRPIARRASDLHRRPKGARTRARGRAAARPLRRRADLRAGHSEPSRHRYHHPGRSGDRRRGLHRAVTGRVERPRHPGVPDPHR